jgi:hypothetical protein
MWDFLERFLCSHDYYRRRIQHALELHRRGEARKDGLQLGNLQHRLEILWRARDTHPWDRHLPPALKRSRFIEQALVDTEAALARLFKAVQEVDVIDLCVTDPASEATLLSGTVTRSDFQNMRPSPSVRMRLSQIGVNLESLEMDYSCQLGA